MPNTFPFVLLNWINVDANFVLERIVNGHAIPNLGPELLALEYDAGSLLFVCEEISNFMAKMQSKLTQDEVR